MDNDKTYMWLVLITFVAFALAGIIAFVDLSELQKPLTEMKDPFSSGG